MKQLTEIVRESIFDIDDKSITNKHSKIIISCTQDKYDVLNKFTSIDFKTIESLCYYIVNNVMSGDKFDFKIIYASKSNSFEKFTILITSSKIGGSNHNVFEIAIYYIYNTTNNADYDMWRYRTQSCNVAQRNSIENIINTLNKRKYGFLNESVFDIDDESIANKKTVAPKDVKELRQCIIDIVEWDKYKEGDTVDLNFINTSNLETLTGLFDIYKPAEHFLQNYNYDVSQWNVSRVKNARKAFFGCKYFDCDLSKWKFSPYLSDTVSMFYNCSSFTGKGLENWNVSNLYDMDKMFYNCEKFNGKIGNWNVQSLWHFDQTFYNCTSFKQNLDNWKPEHISPYCKPFLGSYLEKHHKEPKWWKETNKDLLF